MAEMHENYEDILDFWLTPGMEDVWYANDPKFDAGIRDRFMLTYEAAKDGKLDAWRSQARSLLALIIVLDQFPRNMFRGEARAFATDDLACSLSKEAKISIVRLAAPGLIFSTCRCCTAKLWPTITC